MQGKKRQVDLFHRAIRLVAHHMIDKGELRRLRHLRQWVCIVYARKSREERTSVVLDLYEGVHLRRTRRVRGKSMCDIW